MTRFSPDPSFSELLAQLVAINSVNPVFGGPSEEGVARFVEGWFAKRGISLESQTVLEGRRNLFVRVGSPDKPALLVEAHMDTVDVGGWAVGDPFVLSESEGRLYGRGSCDTKGSLATFMKLAEWVNENGDACIRSLVFAATVDEENEQLGAYEIAKLKESLGIRWALTGEPTRSDVVSRHKGVGRFRIRVRGKAAHGSTPELGENAIYAAAEIVERLKRYGSELRAMPHEREIERGSLNVGLISGGIGFNVVPDACMLELDRRVGTKEGNVNLSEQLDELLSDMKGIGIESFLERPALKGVGSEELVSRIIASAKSEGTEICEREVPYMTNAVAYEAAGIPAVVFGPGDIAQAHKNDEYIEVGEMERSFAVLRKLMVSRI